MNGGFGSIVAVWALVIAPTLCQAGALGCCPPTAAGVSQAAAADGCCNKEHSPAQPAQTPQDPYPSHGSRGTCADLCDAAVKAPDVTGDADVAPPVAVSALPIPNDQTPSDGIAYADAARSLTDLPFSPSDIPKLI